MKYLTLTFLVFAFGKIGLTQIAIPSVPDSLMNDAHSVILEDETVFTISGIKHSSLERNYKVMILDKYAKDKRRIILHYNEFKKVKDARVVLYGWLGNRVKKFSLKDFEDWSTGDGGLASDSRAKYLDVVYDHFPYLIEVSYSIDYDGYLLYPHWRPQTDDGQSVVHASFRVKDYFSDSLRYYSVKAGSPGVEKKGDCTEYVWELNQLPAAEDELFSGGNENHLPVVYCAPSVFEMEGIRGNMSTWEGFGKWFSQLNAGKNNLSEDQLQEVKSFIKQVESKPEIVRRVYDYLQNNFRYVSIQLGIGGWQPFESAFVHEKKYGDCKALSFYTKSVLEALGIPSFYTLVNAGAFESETREDFSCAHFNHAILTVPMDEDTIWLECTSQTSPFGYLGTWTSDRNALLIDDSGGKLIRTRSYSVDENLQATKASLTFYEAGSADVSLERNFSGLEIENYGFHGILNDPETEQEKWFYDNLDWGAMEIKAYNLLPLSDEVVPETGFTLDFTLTKAARTSGSRMFFQPALFTNLKHIKLPKKLRKHPIVVRYPYTQTDSVSMSFPKGYRVESSMEKVTLDSKYGKYELDFVENEEGYTYLRTFLLYKGKYPPGEYEEFREFINAVRKFDRKRVVMVGKT